MACLSKADKGEILDLTVSYRLPLCASVDTNRKIILASSSPFRKELLARLGIDFSTTSPDIDETPLDKEIPDMLVSRLARLKAEKIAEYNKKSIIIASDQVACLGKEILGKPLSYENALIQLRRMRGQTVRFLTSLHVIDGEKNRLESTRVDYQVRFRNYDDAELERYLYKEKPFDCAGSFKSEKLGISLLEEMTGPDPTALIGLPLIELSKILRDMGLNIP
jgi:septum formation protein